MAGINGILCAIISGSGGISLFLPVWLHVRMFVLDRVPGARDNRENGGTVAVILCLLVLSYLIYDDCCKILMGAGYDCSE